MKITDYIDYWSIIVILITALLFIAALFVQGLTHDILLETGVFLVSVKIIMTAYTNNQYYSDLKKEIGELKEILREKNQQG